MKNLKYLALISLGWSFGSCDFSDKLSSLVSFAGVVLSACLCLIYLFRGEYE